MLDILNELQHKEARRSFSCLYSVRKSVSGEDAAAHPTRQTVITKSKRKFSVSYVASKKTDIIFELYFLYFLGDYHNDMRKYLNNKRTGFKRCPNN